MASMRKARNNLSSFSPEFIASEKKRRAKDMFEASVRQSQLNKADTLDQPTDPLKSTEVESQTTPERRKAHNSWVLAFAETGFLGLFLYVLSFGTSVKFAAQIRNEAPEYLLCILGYGIVMTFLSHTYLLYPLLLYGIIGCANRIYREV